MSNIQPGDRFETRDSRDAGRVIEIDEVLGLSAAGQKYTDLYMTGVWDYEAHGYDTLDEAVEEVRTKYTKYRAHSEANPKNPDQVGRRTTVSEKTLSDLNKYRKISR